LRWVVLVPLLHLYRLMWGLWWLFQTCRSSDVFTDMQRKRIEKKM
jgi:hypothetical protein